MKETQENECLKKTFSRGSVYVEIIIILILTKFHSLGLRLTPIEVTSLLNSLDKSTALYGSSTQTSGTGIR